MEEFSKKNMKEFVRYLLMGIYGFAVCITAAHAWNYPEDMFISAAAVISVIGTVYSIIRTVYETKNK